MSLPEPAGDAVEDALRLGRERQRVDASFLPVAVLGLRAREPEVEVVQPAVLGLQRIGGAGLGRGARGREEKGREGEGAEHGERESAETDKKRPHRSGATVAQCAEERRGYSAFFFS